MTRPRPASFPKAQPALTTDLSPSMRAVVYGPGHVLFIRGSETFTVTDLEMARVEHLRLTHRGESTDAVA